MASGFKSGALYVIALVLLVSLVLFTSNSRDAADYSHHIAHNIAIKRSSRWSTNRSTNGSMHSDALLKVVDSDEHTAAVDGGDVSDTNLLLQRLSAKNIEDKTAAARGSTGAHLVPNFTIVGFPKCGTSTMVRQLNQHFMVSLPHHEVRDDTEEQRLRADALLEELEGPIRGTKSPLYIYSKSSIQLLHRATPRPKIVLILRNPCDMLISFYKFRLKDYLALLDVTTSAQDQEGALPLSLKCFGRLDGSKKKRKQALKERLGWNESRIKWLNTYLYGFNKHLWKEHPNGIMSLPTLDDIVLRNANIFTLGFDGMFVMEKHIRENLAAVYNSSEVAIVVTEKLKNTKDYESEMTRLLKFLIGDKLSTADAAEATLSRHIPKRKMIHLNAPPVLEFMDGWQPPLSIKGYRVLEQLYREQVDSLLAMEWLPESAKADIRTYWRADRCRAAAAVSGVEPSPSSPSIRNMRGQTRAGLLKDGSGESLDPGRQWLDELDTRCRINSTTWSRY